MCWFGAGHEVVWQLPAAVQVSPVGQGLQSPSSGPHMDWLLFDTHIPLQRWKPVLHRGTHFVPSQVEVPPVIVGQAMQVLPQDVLLTLLSATQVRAAAVPQP